MPKRRSAPRKRITDKVGKELRSARLSASPRVVTAGKPRYPALTAGSCPDAETPDERVYSSAPARAVARASAFKSGTASSGAPAMLNARETQAPFQGICGDFKRARERLVQQRSFFVQAGWSAGRYVRRVTRKARGVTQLMYLPGAPKPGDVSLKRRQTDLTRAASHLFRIHDLATFDAEQVNDGGLRNTLLRLKDAPEKWCDCAPTSRLAAPTCSPA